ncbi:glycosyltransferase [Chamaesiphon sp. VAR_69_metabat_338]|uniref:glycosyltransferase n=1 Tax=Chamaesiphon sp. VAR_69_metabat_338 TaxID=2964704 RepID=UPI00286E341F|nr:glycosyltransferase [Chamaesiphon sp. VAR_69_metabat_338]
MLNQITKYSFLVDFKDEIASLFPDRTEKIALLVASEYEGYYKNGGIGTYYKALSQRLKAEGWYVILLLCATEDRFQGKSKVPALDRVFSTIEVEEILTLQPIHRAILAEAKSDFFDYQSFCIFFFIQALSACCPAAQIYAEFAEMSGYGYRTIQAKRVGLVPKCVTSVTLHSGHEWIDEANEKFTVPYPQDFWQLCHYEQNSFENADLSFHPSNFIRNKVKSYGWNVDRAIRLPYFVPPIAPIVKSKYSQLIQAKLVDRQIPLIFFGRLEERKGLCTFIQAFKSLDPTVAARFRLVFLGKVIPLQSYELKHLDSQQYIEQELKDIYDYDIFENLFSAEALNLIGELDRAIVCLTSPQDNFPNSALEVGQLPVKIIAADTGGFRETLGLLERSAGVHWFPAGNVRSLTQVLTEILTDDPESLVVPTADFLDKLNQNLLAQRTQYIDGVSTPLPTPCLPTVTICIFYQDGNATLLECLASLHQQTYQHWQIVIVAVAVETKASQQLLSVAQKQFPNLQIVHCERSTVAIDRQQLFTAIGKTDRVLCWQADEIAATEMLDNLVRAALTADTSIATCPPLIDDYAPQVYNLRVGFVSQLLALSVRTTANLLVDTRLLDRLDWTVNFEIDSLGKYLLAIAIATGTKIAYFPYPLYWTKANPENANKDVILREAFKLRQYIATVEPSAWNIRQLYMLKAGIQQLVINSGNIGENLTANRGFKGLAGYSVKTLVKASAWKVAKKSYSRISKYENIGIISTIKRTLVQFFAEKNP